MRGCLVHATITDLTQGVEMSKLIALAALLAVTLVGTSFAADQKAAPAASDKPAAATAAPAADDASKASPDKPAKKKKHKKKATTEAK
jgi:hypothetical protein